MLILLIVALYLVAGILALAMLELATHRITGRLRIASYQTQDVLAATGSPTGTKVALVLTLLALWVLWPVAIYAAVVDRG